MHFERPTALRMVAGAETALPDLVQEVIAICQIPAPTFHEEQRAAYVARRMVEVGLREVSRDAAGNVIGRLRGRGTGPNLLLAAHLDTVFPVETDVTVRVDGEILRAPGVGDNSASVATMLHAARLLVESDVSLTGDVIFAATCGEEGLGNLEGMRAIVRALQEEIDYVIALDGSLGGMVREAVGSRRFRLVVTTSGGHSWGAFGAPSAIHSLGRIIARISELRVPAHPKTTYNVGLISGGTSVNTIAARAEAVLDLRSLDRAELIRLEERVQRIIRAVERETGVKASLELLGDRPTGAIPDEHPLCNLVRAVHRELGLQTRTYPSSTDGNVPLSMGIPAVTVGVTLGGNGHRLDEYIYTSPLARGLAQVLLLVLGVQELPLRAR
ncbi:acetylornithine deacetylase/succinyl-diaminopimelate desuccinylase-like protein [Symbiobacterium terraclitae]|uniref:Acetylornithine deacetylase/succinyl-diaminopimelate desuccinylase-like protein n=1 Tax=Symbiobacterium terraclitae TaxID=557451 RepID=A0ABS4JQ91_9FIRM|nr:M20/M25/M40 family metallo-hydrolase [Symbiobacterium terraclitae]MBP2017709.1 acetylornithine deacetylase/succinyl-diaminopimelate desuccinylase-like protein [Symbiobacterium terraclitae]